ncbi:MAG TPA: YchJ family protein [Geobacteraceae bacterium]
MENCPCGSGEPYGDCCEPLISGVRLATTPEQLMRSRYSAYVKTAIDYLYETTHPAHRTGYDHEGTRQWAESAQWLGLEVVRSEDGPAKGVGQVEFVARYLENDQEQRHHEVGQFKQEDGAWYFTEGKMVRPQPLRVAKIGRNEPCPCGSGAKYKKCCGK